MTSTDFPIHPIADVFPAMAEAEYAALRADIAAHGQREPIWLWQGQVIDGRHRLRACRDLQREPLTREWDGDEESVQSFVAALNLHRRHLSESQRAMVASRLAKMRQGARTDLAPIGAKSQDEAASMLSVGRRSVQRAHEVLRRGVPELVAAVEQGKVTVSAAAAIAKLPAVEQRPAIEAVRATDRRPRSAAKPQPDTHGEAERLRARVEELEGELDEAREGAKEGGAAIEAAAIWLNGEEGRAVQRLLAETAALKSRRDDLMRENAQLKREIKRLRAEREAA